MPDRVCGILLCISHFYLPLEMTYPAKIECMQDLEVPNNRIKLFLSYPIWYWFNCWVTRAGVLGNKMGWLSLTSSTFIWMIMMVQSPNNNYCNYSARFRIWRNIHTLQMNTYKTHMKGINRHLSCSGLIEAHGSPL